MEVQPKKLGHTQKSKTDWLHSNFKYLNSKIKTKTHKQSLQEETKLKVYTHIHPTNLNRRQFDEKWDIHKRYTNDQ